MRVILADVDDQTIVATKSLGIVTTRQWLVLRARAGSLGDNAEEVGDPQPRQRQAGADAEVRADLGCRGEDRESISTSERRRHGQITSSPDRYYAR
jgi:hypothetical protein